MSDFAEQYLEQLPEKCHACPVIGQFLLKVNGFEEAANTSTAIVGRGLQDNCMSDETMQSNARLLNHFTDRELEARKAVVDLVQQVGPNCTGRRFGSTNPELSRVEKLFSILLGDKECRNPNFISFAGNPVINEVLKTSWNIDI
jgi:hypothetical protein